MTVEQFIGDVCNERGLSMYEAAKHVRDTAAAIMNDERDNRATQLRADIDRGKAAEKELASIGAPGRPRKKRQAKGKGASDGTA